MTVRGTARASARGLHADALDASWYARPAEVVARELLGAVIISTIDNVETAGRIVETEAYIGPHDDASHAAARIGRTRRNDAMYGVPGSAYVYRIYGIHWCLNVVTDRVDFPAAVLIRAIAPVHGIDHMHARRSRGHTRLPDSALASGPGRLAAALGITGVHNAHPLDRLPLCIVAGARMDDAAIGCGPRIGITRAADWPLRFWESGSAWISRAR
jgi:DNA-3-methyladenine glycosylase